VMTKHTEPDAYKQAERTKIRGGPDTRATRKPKQGGP
jgi:hypothetical protein